MIVSFQKGVAIPLIGSEVGQMRTALVRLDNWGETPAPSNKTAYLSVAVRIWLQSGRID
jgi:hypothetical protein